MSKFFEYYKKTDYELSGKVFNLTNITLRYKFKQNLTKNIYNFYDYTLKDGERLDHLADMYYGDSKYVWVIILANDIIDPQFEIPKPDNEFKKYVINKYGTWENVVRGTHHYERVAIYKDSNSKVSDLNPPLVIEEKLYNNIFLDKQSLTLSSTNFLENEFSENEQIEQVQSGGTATAIVESWEVDDNDNSKGKLIIKDMSSDFQKEKINKENETEEYDVLGVQKVKKYPDLPVLLSEEKREITNLDYELGLNEGKRTLKLLDVSQLPLIVNLVEEVFNE